MAETASRTALENALSLYAPQDRRAVAETFLEALSIDELSFLAEFLGACILMRSAIGPGRGNRTSNVMRQRIREFRNSTDQFSPGRREDRTHKLIVVTEFGACCGYRMRCC